MKVEHLTELMLGDETMANVGEIQQLYDELYGRYNDRPIAA